MYFTTQEVADRYGISRTTVWRWVKSGRLPAPIQIGPGIKRFSVAALQRADEAWATRDGVAA